MSEEPKDDPELREIERELTELSRDDDGEPGIDASPSVATRDAHKMSQEPESNAPKKYFAAKWITQWTVEGMVLIGLAALVCFVWLPPYRYDRVKWGDDEFPIRINRLTGSTEYLLPGGWHPATNKGERGTNKEQELPIGELSKLVRGQAVITSSYLECDTYNGSDWTVSELTVLVTVRGQDGRELLSRKYRLIPSSGSFGGPLENSKFFANLGFSLEKGQGWYWEIVAARGSKRQR